MTEQEKQMKLSKALQIVEDVKHSVSLKYKTGTAVEHDLGYAHDYIRNAIYSPLPKPDLEEATMSSPQHKVGKALRGVALDLAAEGAGDSAAIALLLADALTFTKEGAWDGIDSIGEGLAFLFGDVVPENYERKLIDGLLENGWNLTNNFDPEFLELCKGPEADREGKQ